MSSESKPLLRQRVLRGAMWATAMRWTIRLISVISMVLLARLLTPADFGIVAMAMIVVGLAEVLVELGVNTYLIQKIDADRDDYNTAWTVRLLQGVIATALLLGSAPLAVDYFSTPDLLPVLWCLAFGPVLSSLENIGIVDFQKNLDFSRDFHFNVLKKLSGFAITISAAFLLRSYWALVIGTLFGIVINTFVSYLMSSFRPRLTLCRARSLLSFSTWLLLRNIGAYAQNRIDRFFVGGGVGAVGLGVYTLASDLAETPTNEFLTPVGRVLYPALSGIKNDVERMRNAVNESFSLIVIVAFPLTVGLALVARDAVYVVLGDRWVDAIQPLQILPFVGLFVSLRYLTSMILTVSGRVRLIAISVWIQIALFALLCTTIFADADLVTFALIRMFLGAFMALLVLGQAIKLDVLRFSDLARSVARPLLACTVMAAALYQLQSMVDLSPTLSLAVQIPLGAAIYSTILLGAWWLSGRPASGETFILGLVGTKLRRSSV